MTGGVLTRDTNPKVQFTTVVGFHIKDEGNGVVRFVFMIYDLSFFFIILISNNRERYSSFIENLTS